MADLQFPLLVPKAADPLWFHADRPCDDENELTKMEEEHRAWLQAIVDKDANTIPIGKTSGQQIEEEEPDDEADADDVSESDNDDELDTDMIDERDSGDDVEVDMNTVSTTGSPQWVLR